MSSIVDMIKGGDDFNTIIEGASNMVQERNSKNRPISYIANGNAQMNVAWGNATIKATQNNVVDWQELSELLNAVRDTIPFGVSEEDNQAIHESPEVIESEVKQDKPKKSILKTAMAGLRVAGTTAEFSAAVATLIHSIQPLID